MWAEAVLMRYRGPVGSFIRANFQHMDERFFMAYLRDKDMKLINEHAERSFISYVSQQYADLGRNAFGESVSQLPRYIELSVSKTSVISHEKYLKKDYTNELIDLYVDGILKFMEDHVARKYYKRACKGLFGRKFETKSPEI